MSNQITVNTLTGSPIVAAIDIGTFTAYPTTGALPASAIYVSQAIGTVPTPITTSNTMPVTVFGAVTTNAGTNLNTSALALETGGNLATIAGSITAAKSQVNNAQIAGTAVSVNSGVKDAGTQRFVLATDQPALSTPLPVNLNAATAGGWTPYQLISAATTNATSVKASAGQIGYIMAYNTNATARFLKFYDKASAPTVGTDTPVCTILLPPNNGGSNLATPAGVTFTLGIAFAITALVTVADTTAVALNDCAINIGYK